MAWGYYGLGVYMTRVRKSYELDNMFAVIFFDQFFDIGVNRIGEMAGASCA